MGACSSSPIAPTRSLAFGSSVGLSLADRENSVYSELGMPLSLETPASHTGPLRLHSLSPVVSRYRYSNYSLEVYKKLDDALRTGQLDAFTRPAARPFPPCIVGGVVTQNLLSGPPGIAGTIREQLTVARALQTSY